MASRKKKDDRRKQQKRARKRKARRQRRELSGLGPMIVAPQGVKKMSEVLLEFVEPYLSECRTEEELKKLFTVALVAWNAALVTGAPRTELIQGALQVVPPEVRPDMQAFIEELIRRKETFFADNKRMMMDYQLTMTPNGPHVSVISTFDQS
jgi:hypothetical protein